MSYLDNIKSIWELVKDSFKDTLAESVVDLWFGHLKIVSFEQNCITFSSDFETGYKVVKEKHLPAIRKKFSEILGYDIDVNIVYVEREEENLSYYPPSLEDEPEEEKPQSFSGGIVPPNYNFEYTFENFIVGNSNKFAHAACTAVAANPATNYNPLFIYGPSGLGKTHLMYAVVNEIKKKKPNVSVVYIKSEDFTNELIESLKEQQMHNFREKYRNCDILLIDDVQFIAGKNSTQEEFFHTFNALYEDHKQIILTSDRPPKDINLLEDRIKNRFEWGLIADIQPPDLELRIAIIKKKAEQVNIEIPNDALTLLAENLRSNIRQIEGAIKKLSAMSFLSGQKISTELVRSCISELLAGEEPVNVTINKIFTAIFKKYGIKKEDIVGKKRNKDISEARHIFIYLMKEILEFSSLSIGKILECNHTSVLYSYDKIKKQMTANPSFNNDICGLIQEVTGKQYSPNDF